MTTKLNDFKHIAAMNISAKSVTGHYIYGLLIQIYLLQVITNIVIIPLLMTFNAFNSIFFVLYLAICKIWW